MRRLRLPAEKQMHTVSYRSFLRNMRLWLVTKELSSVEVKNKELLLQGNIN